MPKDKTREASRDTHSEKFQGPAWDNNGEYPSLDSKEIAEDRAHVARLVSELSEAMVASKPLLERARTSALDPNEAKHLVAHLQSHTQAVTRVREVLGNLTTYVNCERCVDGRNALAQKLYSELMLTQSDFEATVKPLWLFIDEAPEALITAYLDHPETQHEAFTIGQSRRLANTLLSEDEETLLTRFKMHGLNAWGDLYDQISGNLRCKVARVDGSVEEMGLAQASGVLRDASELRRKSAYGAIQDAWKVHESSCAAIVNALAGWRLEETKRRAAAGGDGDFLSYPLHFSRIRRETLDAMWSAVREDIEIPRRAMRRIAQGLGKKRLEPWDLLASPAPRDAAEDTRRTYAEGLSLIRDAFAAVDPAMGEFVDLMHKNSWIEGRVLAAKRQGAFCTRFSKSRTPRVFQTYMGSIYDIRTLAHELGHAYHAWSMRDLPQVLHRYPMTLAETASVFAETAFGDHMNLTGDDDVKLEIAWQNAQTATAFLLNIPSRYFFEKEFYERRRTSFVNAKDLGDLTESNWRDWYGDTLTTPERQFWMTKLHFSIPTTSFYNYPYTFGYLFSLRIYALRKERGPSFSTSYRDLLRDTGRMTAEDLVTKHLGEDITQPTFWKQSLRIVEAQVARFEALSR